QAETTLNTILEMGFRVEAVRTFRKYWIDLDSSAELVDASATPSTQQQWIERLSKKFLANDAIEQSVIGPIDLQQLQLGTDYQFSLGTISLLDADDAELEKISTKRQLSLSLVE